MLSVPIGQDGRLHAGRGGGQGVTTAHIHGPEQSSPRESGSTVLLHTQEGYNWTIGHHLLLVLMCPTFLVFLLSLLVVLLTYFNGILLHPHISCSRGCPCHLPPPQDPLIHDHRCRFFQPLQFPVPAPHAPKPPRLPWVSHHLAPNEARRPEVSASPSSSMAELASIFLPRILSEGPRPFQGVVSVS